MGLNPRLIFVDSCCNSYNLIHSLVYMLERAVEAVDVGQLVDHTEEAGQSNDQPSMTMTTTPTMTMTPTVTISDNARHNNA